MRYAYLFLLLIFVGCSSDPQKMTASKLKLGSVSNPHGKSSQKLGSLKGTLTSKGKVVDRTSGNLGSCKACLRGFKVGEHLTLRVVGAQKNNLKVIRQTSKRIKILDCPQGQTFSGDFSCSFRLDGKEFNLEMIL